MAERGGYRQPADPAPVSGPGSLSRRTDGQGARYMSGGPYGEGQEMMELQTSAPMAKTETSVPRARPQRTPPPAPPPQPGMGLTGLFAPSQKPDEPITAGAPFGPGPSPRMNTRTGALASTLRKLAPYDESGKLQQFLRMAERRGW